MHGVAHDRGLVIQVGLGRADTESQAQRLDARLRQLGVNVGCHVGELRVNVGPARRPQQARPRQSAVLGWLVAELHAGLGQLADDGTGLRRGHSRLVKGIAKFGQGQIALAAAALDQLVHVGRGLLILAGGRQYSSLSSA